MLFFKSSNSCCIIHGSAPGGANVRAGDCKEQRSVGGRYLQGQVSGNRCPGADCLGTSVKRRLKRFTTDKWLTVLSECRHCCTIYSPPEDNASRISCKIYAHLYTGIIYLLFRNICSLECTLMCTQSALALEWPLVWKRIKFLGDKMSHTRLSLPQSAKWIWVCARFSVYTDAFSGEMIRLSLRHFYRVARML